MGLDDKTEEQELELELQRLRERNEPLRAAQRRQELMRLIELEKLAAQRAEIEKKVREQLGEQAVENRDFAFVVANGHIVAVQRPHDLHYRKFRNSNQTDAAACMNFIRPSVLHPDKEGFAALCSEVPAMSDLAAGAGLRLCGVHAEELGKK
jgi:hypothetical protein